MCEVLLLQGGREAVLVIIIYRTFHILVLYSVSLCNKNLSHFHLISELIVTIGC